MATENTVSKATDLSPSVTSAEETETKTKTEFSIELQAIENSDNISVSLHMETPRELTADSMEQRQNFLWAMCGFLGQEEPGSLTRKCDDCQVTIPLLATGAEFECATCKIHFDLCPTCQQGIDKAKEEKTLCPTAYVLGCQSPQLE